jgi:hypothetical protein
VISPKPLSFTKETAMSMLSTSARWLDRSHAGASRRRKRRPWPLAELLEDRCVPATITVTSLFV